MRDAGSHRRDAQVARSDYLYRIVTLIVAIAAGAAAWAEVAEIKSHYTEDIRRRKRVATHEFAGNMLHGKFMENHVNGVTSLWEHYHATGSMHHELLTHSTYADLVAAVADANAADDPKTQDAIVKLNAHVDSILNTFEAMVMEINADILDEDICYAYWSMEFPRWEAWARSYIRQRREDRPGLWRPFEKKAVEWRKRNAALRGA